MLLKTLCTWTKCPNELVCLGEIYVLSVVLQDSHLKQALKFK